MSTQEKLDIRIPYQQLDNVFCGCAEDGNQSISFCQRWNVSNSNLQSSTTSAMLAHKKLLA